MLSQKYIHSEAGAIVAAMSSSSSEAAVQDLLGIMCDAVVVLDEHLAMASPSPKLDARLMLNVRDGISFPSLFRVTDQARVAQFLADGGGAAQSLHANLRDVGGSRLGVQLFHKRFEDAFGRTRHVIGVVEEPDDERQAQPAPQDDPEIRLSSGWTVGDDSSRLGPEGSSSIGSSSSSAISMDFIPIRVPDRDDLCELQIDATSQHFRILACTASVTSIVGPMEDGRGLLDLVASHDQARFVHWVQDRWHCSHGGDAAAHEHTEAGVQSHVPLSR